MSRDTNLAAQQQSPLTGRHKELHRLWNLFEASTTGHTHVVFVSGEPGIGKTRLLNAVAERAEQSGRLVLRGGASEAEGMPPYLPFLEALGQHIRVATPDRLREQTGELASVLAAILPELSLRQVAVDQGSLLIVGCALSNHPNDSQEAEPTLEAIPSALGTPEAAALDTGYIGPATMAACAKRDIEPYIATGRDPHHPRGPQRFAPLPDPPPQDASAQVKMAYKLRTALGKAIYAARKCTVEPVIGIIKEVLGFRQFSLRGELAAAGEWCLVCLAFNLKRFHTLSGR